MNQNKYIVKMSGSIQNARGLGQYGLELVVNVSFDAKEFSRIKKKDDPLAAGMAQIKNVVYDATGVRGFPHYAPISMNQRFPRASKGLVTITLYFDVSENTAKELGADTNSWRLYHDVELQYTLDKTREDGHLFAKTAIAEKMGH